MKNVTGASPKLFPLVQLQSADETKSANDRLSKVIGPQDRIVT